MDDSGSRRPLIGSKMASLGSMEVDFGECNEEEVEGGDRIPLALQFKLFFEYFAPSGVVDRLKSE